MEEIYHRIPRFSAALKDTSSSDAEHSHAALISAAAASKFDELSRILGRGLDDQNVSKSLRRSAQDEESSGNSQRNSYLPRIVLMKLDALALELPSFEEEPLECVAFGNVSPENYIDLFWESVRAANDDYPVTENVPAKEGHSKLDVYEVLGSMEPRILLCYKDQLFHFTYVRYDELVRE